MLLLAKIGMVVCIVALRIIHLATVKGRKLVRSVGYTTIAHMIVEGSHFGTLAQSYVLLRFRIRASFRR
jgi:hypothetical protein